MKKMFKILMLPCCIGLAYAQTGIGTRNPQGALHVDGAKDNAVTGSPTAAQAANDVIVNKTTGFMGVGVSTPLVKLDMRSAGTENALGLGTTNMTAATAAAGAVRYDEVNAPVGAKIQVSDGSAWQKLYVAPQKAVVVVRKSQAQSFTAGTVANITNWDLVRDLTSSFNTSSGEFKAPRDGTYTFLLTFNFLGVTIQDGATVEAQIYQTSAPATVLASAYKTFSQSMTGTSDDANSTRSTQAGGTTTITLYLTANTTVVTRLLQKLQSSGSVGLRLTTSTDPANGEAGFNNLTIIEH